MTCIPAFSFGEVGVMEKKNCIFGFATYFFIDVV